MKIGDIVDGRILRRTASGAILALGPNVVGLLPDATQRDDRLGSDTVEVRICEFDSTRGLALLARSAPGRSGGKVPGEVVQPRPPESACKQESIAEVARVADEFVNEEPQVVVSRQKNENAEPCPKPKASAPVQLCQGRLPVLVVKDAAACREAMAVARRLCEADACSEESNESDDLDDVFDGYVFRQWCLAASNDDVVGLHASAEEKPSNVARASEAAGCSVPHAVATISSNESPLATTMPIEVLEPSQIRNEWISADKAAAVSCKVVSENTDSSDEGFWDDFTFVADRVGVNSGATSSEYVPQKEEPVMQDSTEHFKGSTHVSRGRTPCQQRDIVETLQDDEESSDSGDIDDLAAEICAGAHLDSDESD
eukprot:TRINITY_DN76430_c0_g1_i1.p1 TRINITY_DN76430_c0_g1~~TRINITY_DN76430_c0_g1_i1.p1  ORF type:complete len:371 (+),score=46.18 TRINITY_DN76430_c0_g1_i1:61-1173(+)